jgi:hypothetical protein
MTIKSKWLRWTRHTRGLKDIKSEYKTLSANMKRRDHLGHLGIDSRIILNWISKI